MNKDTETEKVNNDNKTPPPPKVDEKIKIRLSSQDGTELHFLVKQFTKFEKVKKAYLKSLSLDDASVRFMFNGERIDQTKTIQQLDLQNEDVVDVMVEQVGG